MPKINQSTENSKLKDRLYDRSSQSRFPKTSKPSTSEKRPLSATIQKSQKEVFALLSDLQNFPYFFENLEKVKMINATRADWYFKEEVTIPMQLELEKNQNGLVWKAADELGFDYTVVIQIQPAQMGRGTIVRLTVNYDNMVGDMIGKFEKLFGKDAEITSKKNLQRFKAFCETGNVPTTIGQSSGRNEDQNQTLKH